MVKIANVYLIEIEFYESKTNGVGIYSCYEYISLIKTRHSTIIIMMLMMAMTMTMKMTITMHFESIHYFLSTG